MSDLQKLLKFTEFTHKFQQVKRMIFVNHEDRMENDSEHSLQVALLCWYFVSYKKLDYDLDKIIKYALVHDLVETYAGDTYFYGNRDQKAEKEAEALKKIETEFPDAKDITNLIHDYEQEVDKEAKFVNCFEKIIPVLNIYLDNGKTWTVNKVTIEMLLTKKAPKVTRCEELVEIWKEFEELLKENKHMFYEV
ncbi:HD domain-containing protein [bacterium]|nr:MAG: HD domain-containing protein [bacterium]